MVILLQMNDTENPFSPGAGTPPPELAGRQSIVDQALLALRRVQLGRSEKSLLIVGLRGTGKTVLLNKIYTLAEQEGFKAMMIESPDEEKSLPVLLLPQLRNILYALDSGNQVSTKVKKAFKVLKSFFNKISLSVKIADMDFGIDIEPEKGTADSGDLDTDLTQVFVALGEAAQDRHTAIVIIIDELQYLNEKELGSLIIAIHKISQKALPVTLIAAGLPQLIGKAGDAKSYAERLFNCPELGPLTEKDAKLALQEPVQKEGVLFTEKALNEIIRVTEGYPYFLQEWGYQAWNLAKQSPIDVDVIKQVTPIALQHLDQSFFRVRFDRLTPREKDYLRALADFGPKPQRSGDIAKKLNVPVGKLATLRDRLIKKGMIYSPKHGDTAFTVPLFDEFMKRVMP